jgi:ferredoxin
MILWYPKIISGRKRMAKVPYVNKDECTECGVCVDNVPTVFRMDDDNKAEVFDPNGASEAEIQEAMDLCPVACIIWKE